MKNLHELQHQTSCDCHTWVHIWRTTAQRVGHVGFEVGGCVAGEGEYMSIHPNLIPAVGPLTILPLPAGLSTTLAQDMLSEGAALHQATTAEHPRLIDTEKPLRPDQTFKLTHLDTISMKEEMRIVREEVAMGKTAYQLFPKVSLIGFFSIIPENLNYNPLDSVGIKKSFPSDAVHPENCATLAARVLNKGGASIQISNTPWGITPNDVAAQLEILRKP